MNQLQSYLYERVFDFATDICKEKNKSEFWVKIHGKELVVELCKNDPKVTAYMRNQQTFRIQRKNINKEECALNITKFTTQKVTEFLDGQIQQGTFAEFYLTFLSQGYELLKRKAVGLEKAETIFKTEFLRKLLYDLQMIGTRVLINEMYHKKKSGKLSGDSSEEQYRSFVEKFLESEAYIAEICDKYPVLTRCLKDCIVRDAEYFAELIERIGTDKEEIEDIIFQGQKFSTVKSMDINLSDSHNGGRSVTKVELDNGKYIIYKPHNMQNERLYYEFLQFMGTQCGMEMCQVRMITKENYGWSEFIEQADSKDNSELERYYKRIGICLFVSYLLGTSDIHFENIIAMGEYPVIVDLESLVGIRSRGVKKQAQQKMNTILGESVLSSGILPCFYWNKDGDGIDVGAVSGGDDVVPFQIPVIKLKGTSDMHIAYEKGTLKKAKNRARLNGEFIHPERFEREIIRGFEICYKYAVNHKIKMREELKRIQNVKSRYIVGDTQKYSMLLNSSYHPSVMGDGADREMLLYSLWRGRDFKNTSDRYVVESEIYDLLNQDIPYFYFSASEKGLYNSRGLKFDNYFAKIPYEKVLDKLDGIDEEDLKRQKTFIHLSLCPAGEEEMEGIPFCDGMRKMIEPGHQRTREELICAVKCIADKLVNEAVLDEENQRIGWFSYQVMRGKRVTWSIQPCNIFLYDGIAGIAIFFHRFIRYSKEEKYCKICRMLDEELFRYTNLVDTTGENRQLGNSGLFTGEASLLYTYLDLYQLHKDEKYLCYAKKHAEIVYQTALEDQSYDLLDGKAGAVWALCQMAELLQEQRYVKQAEEIADDIMGHAQHMQKGVGWRTSSGDLPLLGMAHGNAGICMALCKLYKITRDVKLYQCVKDAVVYEHENFDKDTGEWIDFREERENQKNKTSKPAAWCYGAGGILLSRLEMWEIEWEKDMKEMIKQDIERASSYLKKNWSRDEVCLCHGECGNLMIWDRYIRWKGQEETLKGLSEENNKKILTCEWYNAGLMNGYTGGGYYLLEMLEKKHFE